MPIVASEMLLSDPVLFISLLAIVLTAFCLFLDWLLISPLICSMAALPFDHKLALIAPRSSVKRSTQQDDSMIRDGMVIEVERFTDDAVICPPPAASPHNRNVRARIDQFSYQPQPDNHGFFKRLSFVAVGQPSIKAHRFDGGLTELWFINCVLKVRVGDDLDKIVRLSISGQISFENLSTNGWIPSHRTLLPAFIFVRYISSVDDGVRDDDVADEASVTDTPQTVASVRVAFTIDGCLP